MKTATITELKNSLSAYLDEVQRGHRVLVTDRRRPVAILEGVTDRSLPAEMVALAAKGLVSMPKGNLDVAVFLALPKAQSAASLVGAVSEDRDGR